MSSTTLDRPIPLFVTLPAAKPASFIRWQRTATELLAEFGAMRFNDLFREIACPEPPLRLILAGPEFVALPGDCYALAGKDGAE